MRGYYAKRDGNYPAGGPDGEGGFAPLFIDSQTNAGAGEFEYDPAETMWADGIDTRDHYTQGDYNLSPMPTRAELANGQRFAISDYRDITWGSTSGTMAQRIIETDLAHGNPIAVDVFVMGEYIDLNPSHYIYTGAYGEFLGGGMATAMAYDSGGVWIENSFGTGWGLHGWAYIPWYMINQYGLASGGVTIVPFRPSAFTLDYTGQTAAAGERLSLSGSHASPGMVKIYWQTTTDKSGDSTSSRLVTTARVAPNGTYATTVTVPYDTLGQHRLLAVDSAGDDSVNGKWLLPAVTALPPAGVSVPGSPAVLKGGGFPANDSVALTWDSPTGPALGTTTSDGTGSIFFHFKTPSTLAPGRHTLYATPSVDAINYFPFEYGPGPAEAPSTGTFQATTTFTVVR